MSTFPTSLRTVRIINACVLDDEGKEMRVELTVSSGKILAVNFEPFISPEVRADALVFDAKGWSVWPGVIDGHVHGRVPGQEEKETPETLRASAYAGGVTFSGLMPNLKDPIVSVEMLDRVEVLMADAGFPCMIHFGGVLSNLQDFTSLARHPAVQALKVYRAQTTGNLLVREDEVYGKLLGKASDHGMLVILHSEHQDVLDAEGVQHTQFHSGGCAAACHSLMRSPTAEFEGVQRDLEIYKRGGYTCELLFAHVSTAESLALIRRAREEGYAVFAESTMHHLLLDETLTRRKDGTRWQVNPPLRSLEDRDALFEGFRRGWVDVIGSDHAPHTPAEKELPFGKAPSGFPGLETTLPALMDLRARGLVKPSEIRRMTSEGPASLYGLRDRGFLRPGMRADLVLVDHHTNWTPWRDEMYSKARDTPFDGMVFKGARVMVTLVAGKPVYERSGA